MGLDKPAADASPLSETPVPRPENETDQEIDDLGIDEMRSCASGAGSAAAAGLMPGRVGPQ